MAGENVTTKFRVDISDLKRSIAEANRQIRLAQAEFRNVTAGTDDWSQSLDGLSARITAQERIADAEKAKLAAMQEQYRRLAQAQTDGSRVIADLEARHRAASEAFGENSTQAQRLSSQLAQAQAAQARNAQAAEDLRISILNQDTAVQNAERDLERWRTAQRDLAGQSETLTQTVQRQENELADLRQQYIDTAAAQGTDSAQAQTLAAQIRTLSADLSGNRESLRSAAEAADQFDASLDQTASGGLDALTEKLGELAENVLQFAADKLRDFAEQALTVGIEFDSGMSRVAAVSGAAGEDLEKLRAKAKEMGETTKFSASEAAEAMNYMAMAGWKTEDMIEGVEGIMNLAAASGEELGTTSDIVTDALTALGMSAGDSAHFADILAAASSNANTDVSLMGESFKYAASVAGAMGASAEDLSIALGLMANSGIKGTQAGNSLKNALVNLTKPTKMQAEAMQKLGFISTETIQQIDFEKVEKAEAAAERAAIDLDSAQNRLSDAIAKYGEGSSQASIASNNLEKAQIRLAEAEKKLEAEQAGVSKEIRGANTLMTDADGNMRSLGDIMTVLRSRMGKVSTAVTDADGNMREFDDIVGELSETTEGLAQAEQLQSAAAIFGKQNMAGMLAIINASDEDYSKLTDAIYGCDGAAKEMSEIMMDNLGGDMTRFRSQLQGIQLMLYEKLSPALRKGAEALSGMLDGVRFAIDNLPSLAVLIGGITTAIIAQKAATLAKTAADAAAASGTTVLAMAQMKLNAVLNANPIGAVIIAVTALTAALIYLWNNCGEFRTFVLNMIDNIRIGWQSIADFAVNLWDSIQDNLIAAIAAVVDFFTSAWDGIRFCWSAAGRFFSGLWETVKAVFAAVPGWFTAKFTDAWNGIKGAFSAVGSFFGGLWDTIKSKFTHIGTNVANAIGGAFKSSINAVLSVVEHTVNNVPRAINAALDLINELPGVSIPYMPEIQLPRLGRGGIAKHPTIAEIGEEGEEAVIPLERNTGGLRRIAALLADEIEGMRQPPSPPPVQQTVNNYNFTQTNNSPQPLSRWEIWRQTQNLLAQLRR